MIQISAGLKNSLIILEHLRGNEELNKLCEISIRTFTNCRECGLTFILTGITTDDGKDISWIPGSPMDLNFTWCVYEHRNTDSIIINGKEGYISMNGELPYAGESKSEYLAEYRYNQHFDAAEKLAELILLRRENFLSQNSSKLSDNPINLFEVVVSEDKKSKSKKK